MCFISNIWYIIYTFTNKKTLYLKKTRALNMWHSQCLLFKLAQIIMFQISKIIITKTIKKAQICRIISVNSGHAVILGSAPYRIWPPNLANLSSKFGMEKANGQWPRFLQTNKGKAFPQPLLCHWHISLTKHGSSGESLGRASFRLFSLLDAFSNAL